MTMTRRELVKRLGLGAGSLVLTPMALQAADQGDGKAPKQRFVFVVEGNGLNPNHLQPVGMARGSEGERTKLIDVPIGDHALSKQTDHLTPWKDRVTVLQGLSGKICGGGHSNDFGALAASFAGGSLGNSGRPSTETIDFALSRKLGGVFPLVELGIIDSKQDAQIVYNCSARGPGQRLPTICRPDLAFSTLFGSIAGGSAKAEFALRSNMLDFLHEDIRRVRDAFGGEERAKIDAQVSGYEVLRNRQSRLHEIESTLRAHAPAVRDKYTSDVEADRLDAHFDLAAAALIGGLTNVVTLCSGVGSLYFGVHWTGLGITTGKHAIGHGASAADGTPAEVMATTIRRYHFELIARLMKRLQAVPDGKGTLLDNTTIVFLSDAAESHHSRCWEWPFLIIGDVGGKLKRGRYIEYPYWGKPGHREIGNLYTTLLHAVGEEREYFGVHDGMLKSEARGDGPLAALLA